MRLWAPFLGLDDLHLDLGTALSKPEVSATPTGVFTLPPDRASMRSALEPDKGGAFQSLLPNRL